VILTKKNFKKEKSIIIILFACSVVVGMAIGSGMGYFAQIEQTQNGTITFSVLFGIIVLVGLSIYFIFRLRPVSRFMESLRLPPESKLNPDIDLDRKLLVIQEAIGNKLDVHLKISGDHYEIVACRADSEDFLYEGKDRSIG